MRLAIFTTVIIMVSCNAKEDQNVVTKADTLKITPVTTPAAQTEKQHDTLSSHKTYSNKRFKEVMVEKIGEDSFRIHGLGQIFEANFNWVVEDGHEELKKGFQMTDAGAPEWGRFQFTIQAKKQRENSTLTLILFESSAMDGSRQHELPIILY